MKSPINQPIETLRLNDREKTKLLWAIEQANSQDIDQELRQLRVCCTNTEATLTLIKDGSGVAQLAVLVRNLSRWGAALVHGRYVHPDTRCDLCVQATNGTWHSQVGRVCHARHIQGTIHELGVIFDEPIELYDFASLSPIEETRYLRELAKDSPLEEDPQVQQLMSKVLIADDFASNRSLYGHWLGQAGLSVTTASEARVALVQIQEQMFDLLVIDLRLGGGQGLDIIKELRDSHFTAPIIAVSADKVPQIEQQALDAGATCFLQKPFDEQELINNIYQLIGVDAKADLSPIYSTLKGDEGMRPLLTEFTRGLGAYIEDLREANAQNQYETLNAISYRLKGAGDGFGFPIVTQRAGELLEALSESSPELDRIKHKTNELVAILNCVKLG